MAVQLGLSRGQDKSVKTRPNSTKRCPKVANADDDVEHSSSGLLNRENSQDRKRLVQEVTSKLQGATKLDEASESGEVIHIESNSSLGQPPSKYALNEEHWFRRLWEVILLLLLLHIGIIFPYRFCFVYFHVPEAIEDTAGWAVVDKLIHLLWITDLIVHFFFTYRDSQGNEETDLKLIAKQYLQGYFILNLVACLPIEYIMQYYSEAGESGRAGFHQFARFGRLHRMWRLLRLLRLVRLDTLSDMMDYKLVRWIENWRFARIIKMMVVVFWVVHIMACGWYLCASLHDSLDSTWLARRTVGEDGGTLLEKSSFDQWVHSMYFVLTVFTTVGFGDISAFTLGEIVYVVIVMIVGSVVHSMILSETIQIVASYNRARAEMVRKREVVDEFARHTLICNTSAHDHLQRWVKERHWHKRSTMQDRDEMKRMLTDGTLPQKLMKELPSAIFNGAVQANFMIRMCVRHSRGRSILEPPPRLSILIALALHPLDFVYNDIVYQLHEHPFNIYLVTKGIFAHIGAAGAVGGRDDPPYWAGADSHSSGISTPFGSFSPFSPLSTLKPLLPRLGTSISQLSIRTEQSTSKLLHHHLSPYKLVFSGNFFGETEIFTNKARASTIRCESSMGATLVLNKSDFAELCDEFPDFAATWKVMAKGREKSRIQALQQLTVAHRHFEDLSAGLIQRAYRARLEFLRKRDFFLAWKQSSREGASGGIEMDRRGKGDREGVSDAPIVESSLSTRSVAQDDTATAVKAAARLAFQESFAEMRAELCDQVRREIRDEFRLLFTNREDGPRLAAVGEFSDNAPDQPLAVLS